MLSSVVKCFPCICLVLLIVLVSLQGSVEARRYFFNQSIEASPPTFRQLEVFRPDHKFAQHDDQPDPDAETSQVPPLKPGTTTTTGKPDQVLKTTGLTTLPVILKTTKTSTTTTTTLAVVTTEETEEAGSTSIPSRKDVLNTDITTTMSAGTFSKPESINPTPETTMTTTNRTSSTSGQNMENPLNPVSDEKTTAVDASIVQLSTSETEIQTTNTASSAKTQNTGDALNPVNADTSTDAFSTLPTTSLTSSTASTAATTLIQSEIFPEVATTRENEQPFDTKHESSRHWLVLLVSVLAVIVAAAGFCFIRKITEPRGNYTLNSAAVAPTSSQRDLLWQQNPLYSSPGSDPSYLRFSIHSNDNDDMHPYKFAFRGTAMSMTEETKV